MQRLFLPLVAIFSILALFLPQSFTWGKDLVPFLLGIIMFGMGATLSAKEFVNVFKNWKALSLGVMAHYTVMPSIALFLAMVFQLPRDLFLGLVLVGCCPAGTASNVMAYIARGNVALSVTMTLMSTFIAPLATPAIFFLIAQKVVQVSFWDMASSIFWIIIFPLILGLYFRKHFTKYVYKVIPHLPSISLFVIAFIIAVVISLNQSTIVKFPVMVFIAVIIHNLLGFAVGYLIGHLFTLKEADKRSISIEVGMQNSALGAALSLAHLSAQAALPSAIFSLWQNVAGSVLAKIWSMRDPDRDKGSKAEHYLKDDYFLD